MAFEDYNFPRVLSLLRKEKGLSQKLAANDLEVSQALLSHYEKGIRRPGLDFLVRAADYYNVSCDYLLGRSPDRSGNTLSVEDIPNPEEDGKNNQGIGTVLTQLNKKLIANSLNILFDLLRKIGSKKLTSEVSTYLMLAVYRMFRVVYSTNPKNEKAMFQVPEHVCPQYTNAAMQIVESNAQALASGMPVDKNHKEELASITVSTESLSGDYPLFASSLLNLVQNSENHIGFKPNRKK